ncbi:hypothetical protein [Antrihabitans cavernicola]|uniref:Uncharacterized protein n=1 Tax=Antrihabitans cavernicola TaxID=2495913 RepID=A0A5A7SEY9_9NOCA|nr:hypothetical protein [Spelaeibacter cavernicola]KAA0023095.1 hypothetical protein FOY51_11475 [Spelaeibacter cavernicola]
MTTFIALVLVVLVLQGLFVASKRSSHGRAVYGTPYRYNFFRGDAFIGATDHIDRDAERAFADIDAISRRAPHN